MAFSVNAAQARDAAESHPVEPIAAIRLNHSPPFTSISSDGRLLAQSAYRGVSSDRDGTIRFWKLSEILSVAREAWEGTPKSEPSGDN
jgi:hypothetical protein